jgi:hypoxanthine-guanine phosphoribosyltransferase
MIVKFMADKLIITFDEYNKIVEKLAIEIHKKYKPTVLVGIMRGAAPILDYPFKNIKTTNCLYCYSKLLWRGNGG